ncbi:MAG: M15 family metallopeptidase [Actinomycetota bacterium]
MRRGIRTGAAAVVGAVVGLVVALAIPVPGGAPDPALSPPAVDTDEAVLGDAEIPTLLAWTPSQLPVGYAAAVRDLNEVEAAAVVHSGVAWLTSWRDRDGRVRTPSDGLMAPVELAGVDPAEYLRFVPPSEWAAFGQLARGGALLGASGAKLRGIGPGGTLEFGGTSLRVRAVVDDELVGAHEVVVSEEVGRRLGAGRARYLLVAPKRSASRQEVERALRRALPAGVRMQIRGPGETPIFRHGDAVLPIVRLKELFGEFAAVPASGGSLRIDPRWVADSIVTAEAPILGRIQCHRGVISQLDGALGELVDRGLGDLVDPADYGGCYSPRFIRHDPGAGISHHAWGVAIDLNVSGNTFGAKPTMDPRIVEVFERWGFTWGGRWLIPDGNHFEFLRFPLSPQD